MSPSSRSKALLSASVPPLRQTTQSTRPERAPGRCARLRAAPARPDRQQVADRRVRRHDRPLGGSQVEQIVEPPAEEAIAGRAAPSSPGQAEMAGGEPEAAEREVGIGLLDRGRERAPRPSRARRSPPPAAAAHPATPPGCAARCRRPRRRCRRARRPECTPRCGARSRAPARGAPWRAAWPCAG